MKSEKITFIEIIVIIIIITILGFFSVKLIKDFIFNYRINNCINLINTDNKELSKIKISECHNKYKN